MSRPLLPRVASVLLASLLFWSVVAFASSITDAPGGTGAFAPESLYLYMDADDLDELYSRNPFSNDRLPGYVVYGPTGERHALDGLRFRGSTSRTHPKRSFNIRFSERQPFLFGSDRMNLKALYSDPTIMREALSMRLWRELGRPAPRTKYFDLWINDTYEGLYVHVERVDHDLIAAAGLPGTGTLVRDEFRDNGDLPLSAFGYDLDEVDDPEGLLADHFDSRGDADWAALAELVQWVHDTPSGEEFAAGLVERVDLEVLIDWLALHVLIGDIDSFADDYWLYLDDGDPDARWVIIPWDKDLTFGSHYRSAPYGGTLNDFFAYEYGLEESLEGWGNALVAKLAASAALKAQLEQRILVLADELVTPPALAQWAATVGADIRDSVESTASEDRFVLHPANHHGAAGRFDDHVEVLVDFVELRRAFLDRHLAAVQGDADTATVEVGREDVGRRLLLTDGRGWTIAALRVDSVSRGGTVTVRVEPATQVDGIDRRWTVTSHAAELEAELSLYYRNEVQSPAGVPPENWYPDDVAVGAQDGLTLVSTRGDGMPEVHVTRVNPFSNKAVAVIDVEPGEVHLELQISDPGSATP
jgi:spore coat protein H